MIGITFIGSFFVVMIQKPILSTKEAVVSDTVFKFAVTNPRKDVTLGIRVARDLV